MSKTSIDFPSPAAVTALLLLLSGDVELNPGPRPAREPKPDKAKIMADKVEAHDGKLTALEELVDAQKALIEELQAKQVSLEEQLAEKQVAAEARADELKVALQRGLDESQVLRQRADQTEVNAGELQRGQVENKGLGQFAITNYNSTILGDSVGQLIS